MTGFRVSAREGALGRQRSFVLRLTLGGWAAWGLAWGLAAEEPRPAFGRLRVVPLELTPFHTEIWREKLREHGLGIQFIGRTREQVEMALREVEWEGDVGARLVEETGWEHFEGEVVWQPSWPFIRELGPDRGRFHEWVEANSYDCWPFPAHLTDEERASLDELLPPALARHIRELIYRSGERYLIRDFGFLYSLPEVRGHERALEQLLLRTRAVMAWLQVDASDDLDALRDYWSVGGLNPAAETVLRGLRLDPGEPVSIDLGYLLPPLARRLLNRYHTLEDRETYGYPDCYWTSVNFLEERVSHRALDAVPAHYHFAGRFTLAEPPYRLGDVYFLRDAETDELVHACVHVADDLVFTKNGISIHHPWVIMRRAEMERIYLLHRPKLETRVFRPLPRRSSIR